MLERHTTRGRAIMAANPISTLRNLVLLFHMLVIKELIPYTNTNMTLLKTEQ